MAKAKAKAEKEPKDKKTKKPKKTAVAKAIEQDQIESVSRVVGFDIGSLMDDELDFIEKKVKISSQDAARFALRVSTGQLALDMFLSGGIVPGGWYTFSGGEQSCKSTLTMSIMASLIKLSYTGISAVFDYEGSTDAEYVAGQLKTFGVSVDAKTIFGVRDPDDEKRWLIKPKIRYYAPENGTRFFDFMSMLRRRLPKKIVEKDGSAWLYFENTKENAKKVAGHYDKKWFSAHNEFKVPASDGHMQAIAIVDSYPAMLPDQLDDDEGSNAMAIQARMFSDGIKRFRGGMRSKMITVVGVNQLRQKPATMFGSPEYEPCGDALKFYCFDEATQIRTNYGTLTAPQIQDILDNPDKQHGCPLLVETQHGFEPIMKAWQVEEDRLVMSLETASRSYVGSDQHRQLVFIHDTTEADEPALRTEFRTLAQIAAQQAYREIYAVMRIPSPGEIRLHGAKEANASSRYVLQFLRDASRSNMINVAAGYQVVCTDIVTEEGHQQAVINSLADVGVIAQASGGDSVVVPGLSFATLRNILNDRCATEKSQLVQRSVMFHLAINDVFPDLSRFVAEYNKEVNADEASYFGADGVEDQFLYLADDTTMELALHGLLQRSIVPQHYDNYEEISRQAAYIEDLITFEGQSFPISCRVHTVEKEIAEQTRLWDVTVPATSIIVTNGFVSHNSDVRIRLASRAVPAGWPTLKDERGIVGEKSVTVEGGVDRYRFIAAKTIKNKMGGIPNQQTWMRLWEADGNGEARGFDPVFDTWHYLKTLGLISGVRKRFKIKAPCPLASDKPMDWDQFRTLINGSKKQIAEVCGQLGVKPAGLRAWCFKFIVSDKGSAMLKDSISHSAKAGDDEGED